MMIEFFNNHYKFINALEKKFTKSHSRVRGSVLKKVFKGNYIKNHPIDLLRQINRAIAFKVIG